MTSIGGGPDDLARRYHHCREPGRLVLGPSFRFTDGQRKRRPLHRVREGLAKINSRRRGTSKQQAVEDGDDAQRRHVPNAAPNEITIAML